jgi:RNA polymerase sigma-70 factor (ECF subfamily)
MSLSPSNPNPVQPRTSGSDPDLASLDDSALLQRLERNEQRAMEEVFRRYGSAVFSVALRVLRDRGQAEDVMQEVLLQLWRKPSAFDRGRGALGAWLLVVTRNRAIDVLRKRKFTDSVDDVVLPSATNLASEAERNRMMEKVRAVLDELPADQRKPLELAYFEGMSHTEIAAATGDPLGTVKTRIRLGLIALRKAFSA